MKVFIYNAQSKFKVMVTSDDGETLKQEYHYFEEDALTAAKYLSVEFNAPMVRKFE